MVGLHTATIPRIEAPSLPEFRADDDVLPPNIRLVIIPSPPNTASHTRQMIATVASCGRSTLSIGGVHGTWW
jgi:hypothetical protein